MTKKIGILVGSLREGSFSKQVAKNLEKLLPADFEATFVKIGDLALYNEDLDVDGATPASWTEFRNTVNGLDAFLFVTPEYNRSVPAALKNALDVGSRPYGQSVWDTKPAAVISVSPGNLSAFGANHHLRQSLTFLNIPTMQQPEAYIGNVTTLLNEDGSVKEEGTLSFFKTIVASFVAWTNTNSKK